MNNPSDTSAWKALLAHSKEFKQHDFRLSELFQGSNNRFDSFSLRHENLLLDYSRNYLNDETKRLLVDLANQRQLPEAIAAMFAGAAINNSEQRAALHVALREPVESSEHSEVIDTLARMEKFVGRVQAGSWTGFSGNRITDIVNIGIGGSALGPALVTDALSGFATGHVKLHFVSNIDPSHITTTLLDLQPESTLFIIASKSFSTLETQQNAVAARRWFLGKDEDEKPIRNHFLAITENSAAATNFGINPENIFPLWDWIGGRYSLWSAIGLPIALAIGMDNFRQLLVGAHAMDRHFKSASLESNMPVMMALITVWYRGFFDCHSSAVVPYSQGLKLLPAYLQQLYMESLGKSVDVSGAAVSIDTGEVLWGGVGSDGQHSYFQLLHQGSDFIPVDFIAFATANLADADAEAQHRALLANCFSQSLALMAGETDPESPHKNIAGNKPSNTLLLNALTPYNLGSLIALFEHKVYVQSVIWNINAFDQWGVELGKRLSRVVFDAFENAGEPSGLDDSTTSLIKQVREWNC
ncbi:MAG: glucose-6-phosphate isomerase [Pseudohongiellaceae bacterium]